MIACEFAGVKSLRWCSQRQGSLATPTLFIVLFQKANWPADPAGVEIDRRESDVLMRAGDN